MQRHSKISDDVSVSDAPKQTELSTDPQKQQATIGQRLGMAAGCLGGLAGFLMVAGYLVSGCQTVHRVVIPPKVIDSAKSLSPPAIQRIEALRFPMDVPVIIRTVKEIAPAQIGSFATGR